MLMMKLIVCLALLQGDLTPRVLQLAPKGCKEGIVICFSKHATIPNSFRLLSALLLSFGFELSDLCTCGTGPRQDGVE